MENSKALWERYCRYFRFFPTIGFGIDVSRMRFPDNFLSSMEDAMQRAFAEMRSLEEGKIANPDENRMVGHYWLRTPEQAPSAEIRDAIVRSLTQILAFTKKIQNGQITPERAPRFTQALLI